MQILSVNVALPQQVQVGKATVLTSIFKRPVSGRVGIRRHNLEGDRQSDLTVHGGPYKAVYAYASEHYPLWRSELAPQELPFGMFGENLTLEGLLETEAHIGDQFRVGSALLQVTQPRMPCFKLGIRFGRPDIVKRFWMSDRPGIYFSVLEEGDVATGDRVELVARDPQNVSVTDVVRLYRGVEMDHQILERALRAPLFGGWLEGIRQRRAESDF